MTPTTTATAFDLIHAHRVKQHSKGYNAAHDDQHSDGSLLAMVVELIRLQTYSLNRDVSGDEWAEFEAGRIVNEVNTCGTTTPTEDTIKVLSIAGAILVAEIERLQRLQREGD